jgi:hypothetical protein
MYLHVHDVRSTLGTREHAVGLIVVFEMLFDRIPREPAFGLHGDVMD